MPDAANHVCRGALTALVLTQVVLASGGSTARTVRFATFNASLSRDAPGQLLAELANPRAVDVDRETANRIRQIHNVAEVLQRVAADVLLVNEFDFDRDGRPAAGGAVSPVEYSSRAARLFQENFLSARHGGAGTGRTATDPIHYAYRHTPHTNTGVPSGFDLDDNGLAADDPVVAGYGNDAFGFGKYPGQYGMTVYSKYPITRVRSFQTFLWKNLPGNLLTNDPSEPVRNLASFYSAAERDALRLSSKNHVDLTVEVDGQPVHFLVSHPTPPVFDGPEDRNGKRNHDEIRFWVEYIRGASYLVDDLGGTGGLPADTHFVLAGDYNADPHDGDSFPGAIGQLLNDPRIDTSITPRSPGAADTIHRQGVNARHRGPPESDTADFADSGPGNLRVDYVLPAANLEFVAGGVFWPTRDAPHFPLVGTFGNPDLFSGFPSSDHRAVWIDVRVPGK